MPTKRSTKAAAPVEEELDDLETETEDEELDELEEDEAVAPTKKAAKDAAPSIFGAKQLAEYISSLDGQKEISARDLRTLLRKMARDGRLDREITVGTRERYQWSGPKDPEAKKIIKAVVDGELEAGKQEALAKLKASKAEKDAAKAVAATPAKKATKKKVAPVVVEDEDDDDEELED